jgi:hypothetical protein
MVSLSFKTLMWIVPDAMFLIFMLLANAGIVLAFVFTSVDVLQPEAVLAMHRIHFSPNGLSEYDDDLQRVYPGKLDSKRFEEIERIDRMLAYENTVMAAKLNAKDLDETTVNTAYLKENKYEKEWIIPAIALRSIKGFAGVRSYTEARHIVLDGKASKLESVVLIPSG